MDAYAFVRETDSDGLDTLRRMVGDVPGVASFLPLAGAYAAFVKVSDEDPAVVQRALITISDVDGVDGVETMVGSSPAARDDLEFTEVSQWNLDEVRLTPERLTATTIDIWDLLPPPPPPPPMPTSGGTQALVAFVLVTTEPGAMTEVYVQVSRMPGLVGAAVVSGATVGVLAELTADDEHALAFAAESVTAAAGVAHAEISVGVTELGAGFTSR